MALSQQLQQVYSNYDDNRVFYDTVQLYHPLFKVDETAPYPYNTKYPREDLYPSEVDVVFQSYFLIRDTSSHNLQLEDASYQIFQPYPFNVIQPQIGEDQQDIGIILDNVSLEVINGIELAATNPSIPIVMTYRVYIEGSDEPQISPITLSLTEVSVDVRTVTCKASRTDLYKRKLPFGTNTYYDSKFKGLVL